MLQEKDDELSDIRQTSERYYSEYQVSSKDLDQYKVTNINLTSEINKLKIELENKKEENGRLIQAMEDESSNVNSKTIEYIKQNESLRINISNLQSKMDQEKQEKVKLDEKILDFENVVAELQEELAENKKEIKELKADKKQLQKNLDQGKGSSEASIRLIHGQIDTLQKENVILKK